jgi:hypothetical protein
MSLVTPSWLSLLFPRLSLTWPPIISHLISTCLSTVLLAVSTVPSAVSTVPSAVSYPAPRYLTPDLHLSLYRFPSWLSCSLSCLSCSLSCLCCSLSCLSCSLSCLSCSSSCLSRSLSCLLPGLSQSPRAVFPLKVPTAVSYLTPRYLSPYLDLSLDCSPT